MENLRYADVMWQLTLRLTDMISEDPVWLCPADLISFNDRVTPSPTSLYKIKGKEMYIINWLWQFAARGQFLEGQSLPPVLVWLCPAVLISFKDRVTPSPTSLCYDVKEKEFRAYYDIINIIILL